MKKKKIEHYFDTKNLRIHENRGDHSVAYKGFDVEACPMCGATIVKQDLKDNIDTSKYEQSLRDVEQSLRRLGLEKCTVCKWWQVVRSVTDHQDRNRGEVAYVQSIVKRFDISSPETPLRALADHLRKIGDDIHHIHFSKMEQLVGEVFKEHFNCEVVHCGQSGDRGIDLLLVQSDVEIIPVQVKRRAKPNTLESATTIREMLGVMFRDNYKKAFIVSTAERYSPSGMQDIQGLIKSGRVDQIELINKDAFFSLLNQYYKSSDSPWTDEAMALTLEPYKFPYRSDRGKKAMRAMIPHIIWKTFCEETESLGQEKALARLEHDAIQLGYWDIDDISAIFKKVKNDDSSLDFLQKTILDGCDIEGLVMSSDGYFYRK